MDRRELKRRAKDAFRKIMSYAPEMLKRYLTKKKIEQITKPLLSCSDLRICEEYPSRRAEIIQRHKRKIRRL